MFSRIFINYTSFFNKLFSFFLNPEMTQNWKMLSWKQVHLHAVLEGAEVAHLRSEDEVSKLGVREEDDEEHDSESSDIFGALWNDGRNG